MKVKLEYRSGAAEVASYIDKDTSKTLTYVKVVTNWEDEQGNPIQLRPISKVTEDEINAGYKLPYQKGKLYQVEMTIPKGVILGFSSAEEDKKGIKE